MSPSGRAATVRAERPGEETAIAALVTRAFSDAPHSDGSEAAIVDRLRRAGALTVSLVAEAAGEIVGHAAFSPVVVAGVDNSWFGLGPVAVARERRCVGIGATLIRRGIDLLRADGAGGCVVLGAPGYYRRFGFVFDAGLRYEGAPPDLFGQLRLAGDEPPAGAVAYHPAFGGA